VRQFGSEIAPPDPAEPEEVDVRMVQRAIHHPGLESAAHLEKLDEERQLAE
jgi:hypothetical protein